MWLDTGQKRSGKKMSKPIVIIESPYAGNVARNKAYAWECLLDSLKRGEAPFASHLLYTKVLSDGVPEERNLGIEAGFAFRDVAAYTAVYVDLGISDGMAKGIEDAKAKGLRYELRTIRTNKCASLTMTPWLHASTCALKRSNTKR